MIGGLAIALFSASVLAPIVSKGGIELVLADGFSSNGDKIGAWYWLRRKGHRAKWEFKLDLNRVKDPYIWINFEVLVADTYDGGPGWNASPTAITLQTFSADSRLPAGMGTAVLFLLLVATTLLFWKRRA